MPFWPQHESSSIPNGPEGPFSADPIHRSGKGRYPCPPSGVFCVCAREERGFVGFGAACFTFFEAGLEVVELLMTAYMSAEQLMKFGADIFVVDLITIAVLREMGVLLTAIIVAGRSGSAFAAEIGAMKLNEETDALRAIGISPMEVLVLPRVIGLVIALPLLTVVADAVGILGGALLCYSLLDMPFVQYFQRVHETVGAWTFWVGIIKAPVFALLIAGAGAYRGMQVRGSSRELGRLTTMAVVQAIFLVIFANAMFAVLLEVVGRSIPELSKKELDTLSVEQVMAVVQLTRGQVSDVEAMLAAKAEADAAGK